MSDEHPTGYVVRLSFRMLIAIVDIENRTETPTSPSKHKGTLKALDARGLIIWNPERPMGRKRLTKLGKAYVEAAAIESRRVLQVWRAELEAA